MKDEYIIINKTALQKRIGEVEKSYFKVKGNNDADEHFLDGRRTSLKEILSQSSPLIPEIKKAFDAGNAYCVGSHELFEQTYSNKENYISNLKLDI